MCEAEKHFDALLGGLTAVTAVLLDRSGRVVASNAGAEGILGYRREELVGRHFSLFHPREAVSGGRPGFELEFAAGSGRFEDEEWRLRKDGSSFWARVTLSALYATPGEPYGFLEIAHDFTRRRQTEQTLRESEERFRQLVQGARDYAIFLLDVSGRVATWNEGAERIKGYAIHEILGEHFSRFYPDEAVRNGWPDKELRMPRGRSPVCEGERWATNDPAVVAQVAGLNDHVCRFESEKESGFGIYEVASGI